MSNKCYLSKRKQLAPEGVHIPNKNEATVLRRIMSETGMSEEQVRTHKKYRVELSEAQKKVGSKSRLDRNILYMVKSITQELKLPMEHPTVLAEIKKYKERWKGMFSFGSFSHMSVSDIILRVRRLRKGDNRDKGWYPFA